MPLPPLVPPDGAGDAAGAGAAGFASEDFDSVLGVLVLLPLEDDEDSLFLLPLDE